MNNSFEFYEVSEFEFLYSQKMLTLKIFKWQKSNSQRIIEFQIHFGKSDEGFISNNSDFLVLQSFHKKVSLQVSINLCWNERKLFTVASTIAASANAGWTQPTYRDAMTMSRQRGETWGFPGHGQCNWSVCWELIDRENKKNDLC